MPSQRFPVMMRLQVVATATATATGRRAFGPNAINAPMAMPAAGQKTATPGLARKAKPNRPAAK